MAFTITVFPPNHSKTMKLSTEKLNMLKLSGITSVLGIDLYKDRVRVVEVRSRGGILNRFKAAYVSGKHFELDCPADASAAERGSLLAEELKKNGIKTRFCVSSVRSLNSREVTADIPIDDRDGSSRDDIESWIRENYQKLIRVPVPLKELAFDFQILSENIDSVRCEISFVRASDRDNVVEVLQSAGLQPLLLSIGSHSSEFAFLTSGESGESRSRAFIFADEDGCSCAFYPGLGSESRSDQVKRKTYRGCDVNEVLASLEKDLGQAEEVFVSGPAAAGLDQASVRVFSPLGLYPEYVLPAGLAVQGFVAASSFSGYVQGIDLRPENVKAKALEERDKSLFWIGTLAMGFILLVLLGVQFGLQSYVGNVSARLDARLESIGPVYTQVKMLKKQVDALRAEVNGRSASGHSSSIAKTLHTIAASVPKNVWLYKLVCSDDPTLPESVDIFGYSRTNSDAADYLADLQTNPKFTDVRVVRVGSPTQLEAASFVTSALKSFVTFEVKLNICP